MSTKKNQIVKLKADLAEQLRLTSRYRNEAEFLRQRWDEAIKQRDGLRADKETLLAETKQLEDALAHMQDKFDQIVAQFGEYRTSTAEHTARLEKWLIALLMQVEPEDGGS